MDVVTANSILYLATSIEAVALRVRGSIGKPDADRVLEWCQAELERLGGEAAELAESERGDQAEAAAQ